MGTLASTYTKWILDLVTSVSKADIRVHNAHVLQNDMAIIFVVNHFTRMETLLLPYMLYRHTRKLVYSLAAAKLFQGRVGDFLRATGTISTQDPDRDEVIIRNLLTCEHPWIFFPEGQMIKDKKVVDESGTFRVYNAGRRRPPHRGAALLALHAEFVRYKLRCIQEGPSTENRDLAKARFGVASLEPLLKYRTVIIPVNVTYYPIRARDNLFLRIAQAWKGPLSPRTLEELSLEGTILSSDTDIDITLGEPIDVRAYLESPENAALLSCGINDARALSAVPKAILNEAASRLMVRYMSDIYRMTTINSDHIMATLVRYQGAASLDERSYREKAYLCVKHLRDLGMHRMHGLLTKQYIEFASDEPSPRLHDFLSLCVAEGLLKRRAGKYRKLSPGQGDRADFDTVRQHAAALVIANETEPLNLLTDVVKKVAAMPAKQIKEEVRGAFLLEEARLYEQAREIYARHSGLKPAELGRPFLLTPPKFRTGIVLVHGYLSCPREVHAMAEYFSGRGYAVYAVRLRGHGTVPEDLAQTTWQDWYESVNRGYAVLRTLTDRIVMGGFSTGGVLALLAAAHKTPHVRAVFAVNAPLALQRLSARFAPPLASMNSLLKRIKAMDGRWDFVDHFPEARDTNYTRNPVSGVRELARLMTIAENSLPAIKCPAYILQGSRDPIVNPSSGAQLFERIGTPNKELTVIERDRHGIINGPGSRDVFEHIHRFLQWAEEHLYRPPSPSSIPPEVTARGI